MAKWLAILSLLAYLSPVLAASMTLRVLAWPGYADPELIRGFEQKTGAHVELTEIDTDEGLWQKLHAGGGEFDVFAVNTAELQRYIAANLVQPVDPALIPNTRRQLPRFRDLSAISGLTRKREGGMQVFAIPYTYSEMGLIYDKRQVAEPPTSVSALWDSRYRGKVIAYNGGTHNFSLAAQVAGSASPFRLSREMWPRAVDRLIDLRRNVLGFYNQPEESVRLFQRHHAALMYANYGRQQMHLLRAAGVDAGYAIPVEGALAWLDCWAIVRGAGNRLLAHAWINHMLEDKAGELLVSRQGLSSTTSDPVTDSPKGRLLWLEPAEDSPRREMLWARIRSGDRKAQVLAP